MLTGNGALDTSTHRLVTRVRDGLGERRFSAQFIQLASAVRRHEAVATHPAVPKRPADHELYRVLDELERAR